MKFRSRFVVLVAVWVSVLTAGATTSVAHADPGPPILGPAGTSLMHGDLASTDSTPNAGPGRTARLAASSVPGGACAATFIGSDGMPLSLCTAYVGTTPPAFAAPTVVLFDPNTAAPLARLQLTKGGLLGGVYGYLDGRDRVVVADGSGDILRVAHSRDSAGRWQLRIDDQIDVRAAIPAGDQVTAVAPDDAGRIWFATTNGVVGTANDGRVASMHLPAGEQLTNGLTMRPGGASVLTTHALYEMTVGADGRPVVRWRRTYDRGPARKPGQLIQGSGTTPTYFGPGSDGWVAIVDNAADHPALLVYNSDTGALVCSMPAFGASGQGTENSPLAWGSSLIIPSTYGYQYPPPAVTGPSDPPNAVFVGGSTRIDFSDNDCHRVWENDDRLATLPKLSRADGTIYALGYGPLRDNPIQQVGPIDVIGTDFATGRRVVTRQVGVGPIDEPMELTGTISSSGALWQATVGHMLKIAP